MIKTKIVLLGGIALATVFSCFAEDGEWRSLFDEKLSNAVFDPSVWSKDADGCLTAEKDVAIWTRDDYSRFELSCEYNLEPAGNSGILIYCSDTEKWIPNAVEIQLIDNDAPKWKNLDPKQANLAFFGHQAPTSNPAKPAGEWNSITVRADGPRLSVTLNGVLVNECDLSVWTDAKKLPNGEAIPPWLSRPWAGLKTTGKIGLQGRHAGAGVRFRNVRIRPLPAKSSLCEEEVVIGKWISGGSAAPESAAPILVKRFNLDGIPKKVVLTLAVAGWHELSINGRRVGDGVLSPVTCQPDKRISSVAYDVAPFLEKGDNVVEILLGNGWFNCFTKDVWGFSSAPWLGAPKVRGELVADGKTFLVTDGSWTVRDSPIVFNALRNGEYYDARREGSRVNVRAVKVEPAPAMAVSPEDAVPCRAFDPISPVRSFPAGNGGTIYDFGSNRTGWCEIEVVGEAGSKVVIDYDECLTPTNTLLGDIGIFIRKNNDPRPAQHDEYTLAGKEDGETWHPRFTYHGFRYAQVRTEGKVELKSIKSVFVHSDFDSVGLFKISDPVFGKLQDATRRSHLSNFTGIPTDCPHREKNGWTGDAQLAMETGLWNFDAKAGYIHFLRMMIDAQKESGAVSTINPASAGWGYGGAPWPAWDAALFEIPWQIYRFYGDDAPAREAYPAMKKYLSFVGGKAREDGLVKHGLGDWCAPAGVKVAPVLLTDSAYVYEFNRRVAFWADRFGEPSVAAKCREKAAKIKASFNREFYKGGGIYAGGEPTSLAAPLYFKGLCADGEERKVAEELLRRVRENGHKAMFGILGAKWIPRVLADYGHIDDAWRIFTQPDAPGWAIWTKDNDTLLESFDDTAGGTPVSHNHIMFGDLSAWAYEYLAGIKIDEPGFAKFHVEPHLPEGVESFEAVFKTPCGRKISVRAWREGGEAKYDTAGCGRERRSAP